MIKRIGRFIVCLIIGLLFVKTAEAGSVQIGNNLKQFYHKSVIINEMMWVGSDKSFADEWIELRNVTDKEVDLGGFVIENGGGGDNPGLVIPQGKVIPANGYFLIANYQRDNTNSALNVPVDWVTTAVSLINSGEQLTLKDSAGVMIDQTPLGVWPAGLDGPPKYRSMERNLTPGLGTYKYNWHTCNARFCHSTTYWDVLGPNWGTPGSVNL